MSENTKPETKPETTIQKRNIFEKRNDDINYAVLTETNKRLVSAHKCMQFWGYCRCDKKLCYRMIEEINHAKKYCNLGIDDCLRCTRFAGFIAYHTKYLCEEGKNCQVTWCQRIREIQKRCNNRFKPKRMKMVFEIPEVKEAVELPDSQEIKAETPDVKTENNNDDFVKQEPIDTTDLFHQVPLLGSDVKTEPAEQAEEDSLRASGTSESACHYELHYEKELLDRTKKERDGHPAVDILEELIAEAIESSSRKKNSLTDL